MKADIVSHERGHLRLMVPSDLEQVLKWRNHENIRKYMFTQHKIKMDEHKKWFKKSLKNPDKHLLIFEAEGSSVGFLQFKSLNSGLVADWGFYLAPDAPKNVRKNFGKIALAYGFDKLNFHKICGRALAINEKSIRFHLDLGFRQEGRLREQYFDGKNYYDVICFGILNSEN